MNWTGTREDQQSPRVHHHPIRNSTATAPELASKTRQLFKDQSRWDIAESYLYTLGSTLPAQTYRSHQATVRSFFDWTNSYDGVGNRTIPRIVGDFLTCLRDQSLAESTITSHLDTLCNILAYTEQDDPRVMKCQLCISAFDKKSNGGAYPWLPHLLTRQTSPSDLTQTQLTGVLRYLCQSQYGTRTAVAAALIYATAATPKQVRRLDRSDLALQESKIQVPVSETHAVSKAGLIDHRTVTLPEPVVEMVEEYLQHEHIDHCEDRAEPLLTTQHGRVSSTTLRRSIARVSETVFESPGLWLPRDSGQEDHQSKADQNSTATPRDIQWLAIKTIQN